MYSNIKIHTQFAQIIRNQILNKLKRTNSVEFIYWNEITSIWIHLIIWDKFVLTSFLIKSSIRNLTEHISIRKTF